MEVKSYTKYVRMSPKKLRQVGRLFSGMGAQKVVQTLKAIPRKSARLILKTLNSAVSNAENNFNLPASGLVVKSVLVEEGPRIKRFRPAARGSAHPIQKKTSHIKIVLTSGKEVTNSKEN